MFATVSYQTLSHVEDINSVFSVVFWLIALGIVYYLYRSAKKTDEYIQLLPVVFLIPCLLFIFRDVITYR